MCERVATLLGKPAAVFLPSGTMCNAIGFRLHIQPGGDAVHLHPSAHPIVAEAGGPSALSGAVLAPVSGEAGMFTADALEAALFPTGNRYTPRSRLVSVEQTTNLGRGWSRWSGRCWCPGCGDGVVEVAAVGGYPAAGELAGLVAGDDQPGEVGWWAVAGGAVVQRAA